MSRILTAIALLSSTGPALADPDGDAMQRYAEQTSVAVRCARPTGDTIIVCGRRAADKWRVPFVGLAQGDPKIADVYGERERWQHRTTPCQNLSTFLVGCGMVGVNAGVTFGASGSQPRLRPLAE